LIDTELFVFERSLKAWGSECVQNIRTSVCTYCKIIQPAVLNTLQAN